MQENPTMYITTDRDYFNAADESYFSLIRGQVKPLPEILTPIIQDALNQRLIREATEEEIQVQKQKDEDEMRARLIMAGKIEPALKASTIVKLPKALVEPEPEPEVEEPETVTEKPKK